jgi:hypothetical protein
MPQAAPTRLICGFLNSRAEFRIKAISDVTWISAASTGFSSPNAASPTPKILRNRHDAVALAGNAQIT